MNDEKKLVLACDVLQKTARSDLMGDFWDLKKIVIEE